MVFLIGQSLFGPSPFAFHLLALLLHLFVSAAIVGMLVRLGTSWIAALLGGVFYFTRDALFGAVAWVAGLQDGLMTASPPPGH